MPEPDVLQLAEQFRRALENQDAKALDRLITAYRNAFAALQDKLQLVLDEIGEGDIVASQFVRRERYRALIEQVSLKLRDLEGLTRTEIDALTKVGINLGSNHARALMAATLGDEKLIAGFARLPDEAIKSLLGFLDPDGPLYKRIGQLGDFSTKRVADEMLNGLTLGYNPNKMAAVFKRTFGMALTDALRLTRTANLYAYREANRATYIANGDVVEGWYWHADLAGACPACIAMHGTFHTNDETLDDHYNGRCAMIPAVKGMPPIMKESGEDWFKQQSEARQREIMGEGKYDLWKEGKIEFGDIAGKHTDEVYGDMLNVQTLETLMGK